jgi:hypothetical protein
MVVVPEGERIVGYALDGKQVVQSGGGRDPGKRRAQKRQQEPGPGAFEELPSIEGLSTRPFDPTIRGHRLHNHFTPPAKEDPYLAIRKIP